MSLERSDYKDTMRCRRPCTRSKSIREEQEHFPDSVFLEQPQQEAEEDNSLSVTYNRYRECTFGPSSKQEVPFVEYPPS